MNIPNKITLFRIATIPLFVYFLVSAPAGGFYKVTALILFLALSLTDAIDGYLARKWGQITQFGSLMDPLADKILVYSALLVFVEFGQLWSIFVIAMLARDFLVMAIRTWAAKSNIIIAASNTGKLKTVLQIIAISFMILNLPLWQIVFAASFVVCMYSGWEYWINSSIKDHLND